MFLLGGMTVALTTGLLNMLVFHADALKTQATVSAGVDLALGLLLLATGGLTQPGACTAAGRYPSRPGTDGQEEGQERRLGAADAQ